MPIIREPDNRPHLVGLGLAVVITAVTVLLAACGGSNDGDGPSGGVSTGRPAVARTHYVYYAGKDGTYALLDWWTYQEGSPTGRIEGKYTVYSMSTYEPREMECEVSQDFGGAQRDQSVTFDHGIDPDRTLTGEFRGADLVLSFDLGVAGEETYHRTDQRAFEALIGVAMSSIPCPDPG